MAHAGGRPTVMTPAVLAKLEEVFALGGSDGEACFYADISVDALYDYQKCYPEFTKRKEALKKTPILKARRTLDTAIGNSPSYALEYLKRKCKKEFGDNLDLTTDGQKINMTPEEQAEVNKLFNAKNNG